MKLLIGVPSYDYMHAEFVKCLSNLLIHLTRKGMDFGLAILNGTLVYMARDKIACQAINQGYTHVLWLDADMIFLPTIVDDLVESGKDFISGVAHCRRPPYVSCLFRRLDDLNHLERVEDYPDNVFQVAGCGFACVLIRTEILRDVQMHYKTCFLPERDWGEDLTFCRRATAMGHKIYADPCVRLGHIGHDAIWPEDHARYMERLNKEVP